MNIWIINHFAYGPDQSAGTRHYAFSCELQKRGHAVLVIASSFYHKGRKEARLNRGETSRRESLEGVPFQWIRTPAYQRNPIKRLWSMLVFSWRVYKSDWKDPDEIPDVIIGSSPSLPAALSAYWVARSMKVPFVLEVRDIWPDALRDVGSLSKWNPVFLVFKWIERFLYRNSQSVITLLPRSFDYIVENGGRRDAISWVPNGVNLDQRPSLTKDKAGGPMTFVYFGAHGPYSGLEYLVQAAEILHNDGVTSGDVRFVLFGDHPKEQLIRYAKALGVGGMFEFRDPVPKKTLWEFIGGADAFIMIARPIDAHRKGISPNKLWEYFAAARPVLFSIHCGAEMAEESGGGVAVTPGDPAALADGIRKLMEMDESERLELGRSGRRYVEETGDLHKLAERMEEVLISVTSC